MDEVIYLKNGNLEFSSVNNFLKKLMTLKSKEPPSERLDNYEDGSICT